MNVVKDKHLTVVQSLKVVFIVQELPSGNFWQHLYESGEIHTRKSSNHEDAGLAIKLVSGMSDALETCFTELKKLSMSVRCFLRASVLKFLHPLSYIASSGVNSSEQWVAGWREIDIPRLGASRVRTGWLSKGGPSESCQIMQFNGRSQLVMRLKASHS